MCSALFNICSALSACFTSAVFYVVLFQNSACRSGKEYPLCLFLQRYILSGALYFIYKILAFRYYIFRTVYLVVDALYSASLCCVLIFYIFFLAVLYVDEASPDYYCTCVSECSARIFSAYILIIISEGSVSCCFILIFIIVIASNPEVKVLALFVKKVQCYRCALVYLYAFPCCCCVSGLVFCLYIYILYFSIFSGKLDFYKAP